MGSSGEDDGPLGSGGSGRDIPSHLATMDELGDEVSIDPEELRFGDEDLGERYEQLKVLGRGGMGEVLLARDHRIGRHVAMKVMRRGKGSGSGGRMRFIREVCVQAQLEHPVVVPVYDVDRDESGVEFFTMKHVDGVTLQEVLDGLRAGDAEMTRVFTPHRLLSAFQQVCLGVHRAHSRGVVHRDLKPGNIMFGDYGEVYVLDWGLAKLGEESQPRVPGRSSAPPPEMGESARKRLLGTPGYMAPEQLSDSMAVDARADVYSLGAILFELVTGAPLHGDGEVQDLIDSTLEGSPARMGERAPHLEVAPELEALCEQATARDPADRPASARALHDGVQRYLEGHRDRTLRVELAARHAQAAERAAQAALSEGSSHQDRVRALKEAGRALALDPEHPGAARVVARLLLEPPAELPPDVQQEVEGATLDEASRFLRYAVYAIFAFLALTGAVLLSPVRSWLGFAVMTAPVVLGCLYALWLNRNYRHSQHVRGHAIALFTVLSVAIGATSGLYGPMMLTPLFALVLVVLVSTVGFLERARLLGLILGCLTILVPFALEWAGVVPPSYEFVDGTLVIIPRIREISPVSLYAAMVADLVTIVVTGLVMWRFSSELEEKRRHIQVTGWHLRQLLPDPTAGKGGSGGQTG